MSNDLRLPAAETLTTLQPAVLAERAAAAVRELLAEAAAANTTRSYASALRYWAAWFQGRFGQPIALEVGPAPQTRAIFLSGRPDTLLAVGTVIGILLALAMRLAARSRERAAVAERKGK